jgi:tetratricopeptide (TPR) repeat protein
MYNQKGNPDKAIEYYNKAISLDDKNSFTYVSLGNMYNQKGNPDKAIEYYNKAISLDDKDSFAYYNLGSLYSSLNRKDDALKILKILKGLNKNLADNLERQMQQPNTPLKPNK